METIGELHAPSAFQGNSVGQRLKYLIPRGGTLPEAVWRRRHAGILALLWLHVPALFTFALLLGYDVQHALLESAIVAVPAICARTFKSRRASVFFASMGLMSASAVLVHLSGGMIEAHFHFFVMVGVVVLYQEWTPYLFAIGWVVLHHGVIGVLSPESVYNHPSAWQNPWIWAGIHGVSVLAMSLAGIATWRLNEILQLNALNREASLAEAQKRAHLGSWKWNVARGEMFWSAELLHLVGRPNEWTPSYEAFMEMVHPEDKVRVAATAQEAWSKGSLTMDFRMVLDDGSVRWMSSRGNVAMDRDGDPLPWLHGTCQDVTEAKIAEAELVLARDEAVEASKARSDFLATMSHEIRTPMNGVIGLTGLLLDGPLSERQREYAVGVRSSGEALLRIINDILDFSKIEAGKLEMEAVDFDVSDAVDEVAALIAGPALDKGLELVVHCLPDVPTALRGDVGRIRQVLLNLACNAV